MSFDVDPRHSARAAAAPATALTRVRVDAHAHLHRGFDLAEFVRAASRNLYAGIAADDRKDRLGCLLVAGVGGSDPLMRVEAERGLLPPGWRLQSRPKSSLLMTDRAGDRILLVAGRQVRTLERLELLVFNCDARVVDGRPFDETIQRAVDTGAHIIVPWALGKWSLRRGALVRETLGPLAHLRARIFLGDNGNRASRFRPRALDRLARLGFTVLPGSDPIAHPEDVGRVGGFGFELECPMSPVNPYGSLFEALGAAREVRTYGSAASVLGFVAQQIRVRIARGGI